MANAINATAIMISIIFIMSSNILVDIFLQTDRYDEKYG